MVLETSVLYHEVAEMDASPAQIGIEAKQEVACPHQQHVEGAGIAEHTDE